MSRKALAFVLAFCIVALGFLTIFVLYATVWKSNYDDDFTNFINSTLLTETPKIKNQTANVSTATDEWLSPKGVLGYTVHDFDNDGKNELLVARSVFIKGKTDAYIYLDMYENKGGKVKSVATKAFSPYKTANVASSSLSTKLTKELSIHISVINVSGKNYIMCEESYFGSAFSEGSTINYWMLEYKSNTFNYVASFTQTAGENTGFEFTGYDFSAGNVVGNNIYYRDYTYEEGGLYNHFGAAVSQYFSNLGIVINDYTSTSENTLFRYFNSILSSDLKAKKCCSVYNRWTVADNNIYKFEFTVE